MPFQVVTLNVSQTSAPTPSTLQQTGALISQGATTLSAGTYSLVTQVSDLTALLASPLAVSSLVWSAGTVVVTTTVNIPGANTGDIFITTLAGVTASGYNGTYSATITGANTFTFALATNPGSATVPGTYTPPNQGEIVAMDGTFFSQGSTTSCYVLELGAGDSTTGPVALTTFINNNPKTFYSYLVPRSWDATANYLAMVAQYEANTAMTYFFTTTTLSNYASYSSTMKSVVALIEAPSIPLTEFSIASAYQTSLSYNPNATNRMTPFAYSYLYGVTSYPTQGNSSLLQTLQNAYVNVVGTGNSGGISTDILWKGTTLDGRDFSYWYSVDWLQINASLNINAAVFNGANNPDAPLWYDQQGINTLQDVLYNTVSNAITFGLATGTALRTALDPVTFMQNLEDGDYANQCVINAIPFTTYLNANPGNYKTGVYGGFSIVYIPKRPFEAIIINISVTDLVSQ